MKNKILITGSSGFSLKLSDYLKENDFECYNLSLRDDKWKTFNFSDYSIIVHFAGKIPEKDSNINDFYRINRDLTKELGIIAKNNGIKSFIYLSSIAVYNIETTLDFNKGIINDNTPCNPISDYGKSKYQGEIELQKLESDDFSVSIIRSPSIYDESNLKYFSQFEFIINKFKSIPIAFVNNKRSAIYSKNLFELIRLIIINNKSGIFCPDDGHISTYELCSLISNRKKSRFIGFLIEKFLKNHNIIKKSYSNIAFDCELSNIFEGKYRIYSKAYLKNIINNKN